MFDPKMRSKWTAADYAGAIAACAVQVRRRIVY